jgi:hypothetical protein
VQAFGRFLRVLAAHGKRHNLSFRFDSSLSSLARSPRPLGEGQFNTCFGILGDTSRLDGES